MNAQEIPARMSGPLTGVASLVIALLLAVTAVGVAHAEPAWSARPERSNSGEVQFSLTPRGVGSGKFRVDVTVTTHAGSLSEIDLMSSTELRVNGLTLRPVSAPSLSGHHARGRLEFALNTIPDTFEIVMRGVRGAGDVVFRWP